MSGYSHEKQKQEKTIIIESTEVVQETPRITIPRQGYPYPVKSGDTVYLGKALPGFFLAEGEDLAWRVHYGGLQVDEPAVGVRPAIVIQTR